MEQIISNLLQKFERGALGRRELIQRLSFLAATAAGVGASGQNASVQSTSGLTTGFQGDLISHVSLSVSDLQKSADFYRNTFGLKVLSEDKKQEIMRLGKTKTLVSLRRASPAANVDHFAIGVEGFNRDTVTADLKARGVTPSQNVEAGFHVTDPDGFPVQID